MYKIMFLLFYFYLFYYFILGAGFFCVALLSSLGTCFVDQASFELTEISFDFTFDFGQYSLFTSLPVPRSFLSLSRELCHMHTSC